MSVQSLLNKVCCVALISVAGAGCATKGDLRDLRNEMIRLQARQDSMFRVLQRQNQILLDTLHVGSEAQVRMGGDLSHRLLELERQIVRCRS